MKMTDLKSFDIATYDVEIEFNKKLAPIQKKIDKLDESHETKSLKAHKDFLIKEKSSKSKVADLDKKHKIKLEKIEAASANKLEKLIKKEDVIKNNLTDFKSTKVETTQEELDAIEAKINQLAKDEKADILVITDKYKKNVESYIEKLDTYNNNFENNKTIFSDQYAKYNQRLDETLAKIEAIKTESDGIIQAQLKEFLTQRQAENDITLESKKEVNKIINREVINIRKESNIKTNASIDFVEGLKNNFINRYKEHFSRLEDTVEKLNLDLEERKALINKDLQINLQKVDTELENLGENKSRKVVKSINNKRTLFTMRAETIIKYEEQIHIEKAKQIEEQIDKYQANLENELLNLDKLAVFLVNDQDQLKDTGEYFKTLNLEMKSELTKSELANNEYFVKNELLKTDYANTYTKLFNDVKRKLIESNKAQIDQLTTINAEIDDINKFLDTVEPLKEIELNKLRESIETAEVEQRYKIRYAKQNHEIKLAHNNSKKEVGLEEIKLKTLLSENNKDIAELKLKETMDKQCEEAKLKFNKANEVYKLRLNRTKLERNILKSSYDTELDKTEFYKELVSIKTQKNNLLQTKEIESDILNITIEADYKREVINKRLEEDILTLKENVSAINYKSDAFEEKINQMINKEEQKVDREIVQINKTMDDKLALINEALQREIKEPSLNVAHSEVITKERLSKLTINQEIFDDYIASASVITEDEEQTVNQQKISFVKDKTIYEKVDTYIDTIYEVLVDAVTFMKDIEEVVLSNQIDNTKDQSKIKRLKRQIAKLEQDKKRQLSTITNSRNDNKSKISTLIKGNFQRLNKLKKLEFAELEEQITLIFKNIVPPLKELHSTILKEINHLYLPLTVKDQAIIDNANKNAVKAINRVEKERETLSLPFNTKLGEFIKAKQDEKHSAMKKFADEAKVITSSIDTFKDAANEKLEIVNANEAALLDEQNKLLQVIKTGELAAIEIEMKNLANQKLQLEQSYLEQLAQLDEKDEEAKKIYEYEERIYNIALETAESRYNDAVLKSQQNHESLLTDGDDNNRILLKNADKNVERIKVDLINSTNEFEKNIFTTRPRFEESIGDAQRAIDEEKAIKLARKEELLKLNESRTQAIETGIRTSFEETYAKLNENLQFYLDKHAAIEREYKNSLNKENKVIQNNFEIFKNALFELGKTKISKTRTELLEINNQIK